VREWVSDQYAQNYYSNSPLADPAGPQAGQGGQRGNFGGRGRRNNAPPNRQPNTLPIAYPTPAAQGGRGGPPQGGRGNFRGPDRQLPIIRGGSWDNPASFVRISARYHYYGPTLQLSDIGMRAVREPLQPDGGK
jgi:formylglycine-generating enzyme required for sulfatase activity